MIDDVEREAISGESEGARVHRLDEERRRRERPPMFRVLGPDAIFAPLPPEEHVIGGLLPRSSLLLLGGYGSSGKTWMACDLLAAVGSGDRWLGRLPCPTGRALFLDYESGERELRRRLQLLARGRGVDRIEGIGISCMPAGYLGNPQFERELIPLAKDHDLIILDSLKAASPGADENDSSIRAGLDMLRRTGELFGCAFVVLVHSKKKGGEGSDEREQLRGSSGIFDAADAVLVSTWSKADERFEIGQTKARTGKAVEPFRVSLADDGGGVVLSSEDVAEAPRAETFDRVVELVRIAVRQKPDMGTVALRAEVRAKRDRVDGAVEYLLNRGEVVDLGKGQVHRYRLHNS